MSYWELEEESWENEDNWDGAKWMTIRGRMEQLEKSYSLDYNCDETE